MAINLIYYFVRLLITWIKTCRRFCNWHYLGGLPIPPRKVILLSRIFSTSSPSAHITASWQSFIRVIDACRASFHTKKPSLKSVIWLHKKVFNCSCTKNLKKKKNINNNNRAVYTNGIRLGNADYLVFTPHTAAAFFFFFFLQFPLEYYVRIGRDNKHADYLQ